MKLICMYAFSFNLMCFSSFFHYTFFLVLSVTLVSFGFGTFKEYIQLLFIFFVVGTLLHLHVSFIIFFVVDIVVSLTFKLFTVNSVLFS